MEIVSKKEGSKVTMEITGWLDTQTAPQLEKELSALDPGTTSLVFDFANLENELIRSSRVIDSICLSSFN